MAKDRLHEVIANIEDVKTTIEEVQLTHPPDADRKLGEAADVLGEATAVLDELETDN